MSRTRLILKKEAIDFNGYVIIKYLSILEKYRCPISDSEHDTILLDNLLIDHFKENNLKFTKCDCKKNSK